MSLVNRCASPHRARLLDLSVGLVEDLRRSDAHPGKGPEGFCADFQICLPYRGLFVWHVGTDDVVGDATQVVYVRADESYRMSAPAPDGYSELILTPDVELLAEVIRARRDRLPEHPLFSRRVCRADEQVQVFRMRFLHWARRASDTDVLEAEELVVRLLKLVLHQNGHGYGTRSGASTARLIRRTKEYVERGLPKRLRLLEVAAAVGASPAYLTDVFRRVEGVSLHKYVTSLRLARALIELPHAGDLTALALDLGFSSHSHFSFAFRRAFGSTPSRFREETRRRAVPAPPMVQELSAIDNARNGT